MLKESTTFLVAAVVLHVLHLIKKNLFVVGSWTSRRNIRQGKSVGCQNSKFKHINGTVLYICSIEDNSLFKVCSYYNRQNICFSWMHIVVCGHCMKQCIKTVFRYRITQENSDHVCEKFGQIFEKGTRK